MTKKFSNFLDEKNQGLWANIHAKRKRGEKMRKPGEEGAPTDADFKRSQAKESIELDEVSTDKLRDYASAALQDKDKAKTDKRWKYASKAMKTVGDREAKAANDLKYNRKEAVEEKTLTPAEKKKREEIAKAMERDNPGMDMKKKMAIATWQAKKVAEAKAYVSSLSPKVGEKGSHDVIGKDGKVVKSFPYTKDGMKAAQHHLSKMKEEVELEEGLYHVEYGRSGKLTHQVVATDANDAHKKAMAHLKKKNPKLAHPDYADTFKKPSVTHIKGNEPRADKYKTESVNEAADPQMDKIKQLVRLGLMDKSDMTKIVRALNLMNAGKTVPPAERGILFDMLNELIGMITGDQAMFQKARKAVQEAYEDDEPASPDEAGMAMSQLDFIAYASDEIADYIEEGAAFPEWFQNKLTGTYESMKDLHAYMEGENSGGDDDEEDEDMEESVMSADKKPEKFIKPDGTVGIRMIATNKKVIKDA